MRDVTIHESGQGADMLRVNSLGNGRAYAIEFGEAGAPMRNLFFQGDDATDLRARFDIIKSRRADKPTRDIWLSLLDEHL